MTSVLFLESLSPAWIRRLDLIFLGAVLTLGLTALRGSRLVVGLKGESSVLGAGGKRVTLKTRWSSFRYKMA